MLNQTTKSIKYIREKVVMSAHPECETYKEALEEEHPRYYHPLTLARVMNAVYEATVCSACIEDPSNKYCVLAVLDNWKFLKKDGTDALLEDQSEETILSIARLLGWKDEI